MIQRGTFSKELETELTKSEKLNSGNLEVAREEITKRYTKRLKTILDLKVGVSIIIDKKHKFDS